jgi:hypothetical protein
MSDTNQYTITSADFTINTHYNVRVSALNGVGYSTPSPNLDVWTDGLPIRMNDVIENSITSATFNSISWTPITLDADTGRDPIIYYKLEWDQGINTWLWLNANSTSLITAFNLSQSSYTI